MRNLHRSILALTFVCLSHSAVLAGQAGAFAPAEPESAEPESNRLALRAAKILTAADEGPAVIDNGVVLIKGSRIEAIGTASEVTIPDDYELVDCGANWLMPGMVELHNHTSSGYLPFPSDLNDTVYLTNPGLSVACSVRPGNMLLKRGVASGVTTVLYIPGSGSNIGGGGVLLKIGLDEYEDMVVRDPGSMKLAQSGNPEGWTVGVGRSMMNWNTRNTFLRGKNYYEAWKAFEEGRGPEPKKDIQFEIFRDLFSKKTQVSTHTQMYQVVMETITMVRRELGLDVYIDHGSFDGYRTAPEAQAAGVPAILGPRMVSLHYTNFIDQDGAIVGMAAGYQAGGHTSIGFNTDCVDNGRFLTPPQEELQLQAGMSLRYGLDNSNLEGLRGLTIIPARAAGLGDRLGSLEVGKDADIVVISGDPADPRCAVDRVYTNGQVVYDATQQRYW